MWIVAYESDAHHEVMIANSTAYSMISESVSISLHDLEALKDKKVKHVPVTYFSLEVCLGSLAIWLKWCQVLIMK